MITFKHAGDLGDIIYSLPTIQYLGGDIIMLEESQIPPERGGPRKPLSMANAAPLIPLLKSQPYVHGVQQWAGEPVTVDFNQFRVLALIDTSRNHRPNLAHLHALVAKNATGLDFNPIDLYEKPWLHGIDTEPVAKVLFARSARYHNSQFPWRRIIDRYGKDAAFLGLKDEHEAFCKAFSCDVPWFPTSDLLIAARAIAGCKLFVGGQSCLYPIAEGLKKDAILEVWPRLPTNLFFRRGVIHGWDGNICLPEV